MAEEGSTTKTAVKTYVPTYQKATWQEHAAELDMSQSEFVRTMVQAGRRHYTAGESPRTADTTDSPPEESGESDDLQQRIETLLAQNGPLAWDELLAELTDDIETRLDDSLDALQASNTVTYSGRDGGYTLRDS